MFRIIIIILLCTYGECVYSQHKEGFNWITGTTDCRVSFDNNDTNATTFKVVNYNTFFLHGTSCISDSNGKFLFSCDGFRIWDTMGNKMENGDSLCPNAIMNEDVISLYDQSSIILPFEDGIYYVVTPTVSDSIYNLVWTNPNSISIPFDLLLYHKVDLKENGGAGKVVKKSIPILKHAFISKVQMQACRHQNGIDWWLLKQGSDTNIVYRFLFTKDSIYGPYSQSYAPFRFGVWDNLGQSCFNKEGTKYAVVQGDTPPFKGFGGIHDNGQLFIADFDRCTGELSNPKYFNIPNFTSYDANLDSINGGMGDHGGNGVCFSENSQFVYVSKFFNIFQFEIKELDSSIAWYHVAGLDTSSDAFTRYENIFMAPDHKVYVGNFAGTSKQMSVINSPEIKGVGCDFCPRCLRFPFTGINQPPNMPDYTLNSSGLPCWPLDTNQFTAIKHTLTVFPNPSNGVIYIEGDDLKLNESLFVLYDIFGQIVFKQQRTPTNGKIKIDISTINSGVYLLKCNEQYLKIVIE